MSLQHAQIADLDVNVRFFSEEGVEYLRLRWEPGVYVETSGVPAAQLSSWPEETPRHKRSFCRPGSIRHFPPSQVVQVGGRL